MCVKERECEDSRLIEDWSCFRGYLSSKLHTKWCMGSTHDWNTKSQDRMEIAGFRKCFTDKAFSQDTRETFCFAELSFLIYTICTHTIYTHITHRCWGVLLRENPSRKHWELKIVIPTILYTITYGFSLTLTSLFPYHWEVDSPNTYHALLECQVRFLCC